MDSHLSDVWFELTDLHVSHGSGAVVTTTDGHDYLDLTSGIGMVNTGHCHPTVVEAIREQAGRFLHAQVNCYRHDRLEPLAARLAEITPDGIEQFFLSNSGAEATEAAVKLAKQATGRPHTVVFQGSFHGRTHLTMAMTTSKAIYRAGHAPLPSGVFVAPFPYTFLTGEDEGRAVDRCLAEFDLLLKTQTAPDEVACAMIEPVLGEGGYVPAPARFLHGLLERCHAHGILFVADEVQSGFGRTGELFAIEHAELPAGRAGHGQGDRVRIPDVGDRCVRRHHESVDPGFARGSTSSPADTWPSRRIATSGPCSRRRSWTRMAARTPVERPRSCGICYMKSGPSR